MAFAPYGDEWRQRRQICTLHLLSPKMVQSYALVREQEVATMVAAICSRGSAAEIDMSPVLFAFSNDILCRIVTGKKFEGKKGLFSKLISENSVLLAKIYLGDYLPWLGWVDWLLGKVIKEHEERVSSHDEKDFVDVLISLQKDPVLESILTPEVIKALLQVYLPVFFGVVGSPAREGSFGEKLSSWDCFGRSSIRGTDGEG
ncbi:cytochrome P450 71A26-like [Zingiber officinale]|uniref:cytochrome P450 71A26-like n=1 Tax=Zingiber officinale TaxID=94328 RepID=UPI001C4B6CF4|nr:cytochrome P450 71A26-like [Zingiber officinale]